MAFGAGASTRQDELISVIYVVAGDADVVRRDVSPSEIALALSGGHIPEVVSDTIATIDTGCSF